jgi:DNA-binding transcriptional LysR family regulator
VHAPTFEAVLQCVQEGVGIALVPRPLPGRRCRRAGWLPWARRGLAQREQKVVTREPETLPAYARDFVAYVAAQPLPEEGAVQESLP